jgi:hypothetical protein
VKSLGCSSKLAIWSCRSSQAAKRFSSRSHPGTHIHKEIFLTMSEEQLEVPKRAFPRRSR